MTAEYKAVKRNSTKSDDDPTPLTRSHGPTTRGSVSRFCESLGVEDDVQIIRFSSDRNGGIYALWRPSAGLGL